VITNIVRTLPIKCISFAITIAILAACSSTPEEDGSSYPPPAPAPAPTPVPSSPSAAAPSPQPPTVIEDQAWRDRREQSIKQEQIRSRRVDPTMVFKHYGVNPTVDTEEETTTTFSIDVDTASYDISRAFLQNNRMPDPAAIRVEEFVNAFDYAYAAPAENLFALNAEAFPSPFRRGYHVLHLGVKGADVDQIQPKNSNITFLIDVSGSMEQGQRLEIVKQALVKLINELKSGNTISVVAYSNNAFMVLEPTDTRYRRKIINAINELKPLNSTNIQAGLELAYQIANKSFHPDFNNRIILASDGVANTGDTRPEKMLKRISEAAQRGINLNAVGVGMGNYNDVILENLARLGQGQYGYINSPADANKYFSQDLISSLQVLAKDVRVQVEFDPTVVSSYRLLGYENRGMDNKDFNNDRKDAGEVGVRHTVTAIYEVKFRQIPTVGRFGVFRIAYKLPDSEQLINLERDLPGSIVADSVDEASPPAQLSYVAAAFAEQLRSSYWSRTYNYTQLEDWSYVLRRQSANPEQVEALHNSIVIAGRLDQRGDPYEKYVSVRDMDFDRVPVLQ